MAAMAAMAVAAAASCDICLEAYTSAGDRLPLSLPCGHSLCKSCTAGIRIVGGTNTKQCPTCRVAFPAAVDALRPNYAVISCLEAARSTSSSSSSSASASSRSDAHTKSEERVVVDVNTLSELDLLALLHEKRRRAAGAASNSSSSSASTPPQPPPSPAAAAAALSSSASSTSSSRVLVSATRAVRISGATGENAAYVNGVYEVTDEVSGGMPVYKKRGGAAGIWLEFHVAFSSWMVRNTEFKGQVDDYRTASIACPAGLLPNRSPRGDWHVFCTTANAFVKQASVLVSTAATQAVRISGAVGDNANHVNGVYEPCDEVSGGQPMYRKQDGSMWLEYHVHQGRWMCRTTANKGQENDTRTAHAVCVAGVLPDKAAVGSWEMWNADFASFLPQANIVVSIAAMNALRISGATGSQAVFVNGVFEVTDEVSGGHPVFRKAEGGMWLEYHVHDGSWMVRTTANKGQGQGHDTRTAHIVCGDGILPNKAPVGAWRVWDVASNAFQSQASVVVSVAAIHAVRISGVTGNNAAYVNGLYEPWDEISGGMPVYRREGGDEWLEWHADNEMWMVKTTANKGQENDMRTAYISCVAGVLPAKAFASAGAAWHVWDVTSASFLPHANATTTIATTQALRISGAVGDNAEFVNGLYTPTDEVSGGMPVYAREGGREWLEWHVNRSSWMVRTTASKGQENDTRTAHAVCVAGVLPDKAAVGAWEMWNADFASFLPQANIVVSIAAMNALRISGATGSQAVFVNGVFEVTDEVSGGHPLYRKEGGGMWLEYHVHDGSWMVRTTANKGQGQGHDIRTAHIVCGNGILPNKAPVGAWRVWDVASNAFQSQASVVVSII